MRNNGITGEPTQLLNQNWIAFIGKEESLKIPYCDVLYIEQRRNVLHIQKDEEVLQIPGRISEISKVLGVSFCQCHSYLMINIDRVYGMTKGQIIFDNQMDKYLGRDSFKKTRKKFNKYLLGQ